MRNRTTSLERSDKYLIIGLIVFLVSTLSLLYGYRQIRLENSITETIQCEVVDKYYEKLRCHGEYQYYIVVSLEHTDIVNTRSEIEISFERFESVHVGDKVLCEVIYDTVGIIEVEVID